MNTSVVLQAWEGIVFEIGEKTLVARLTPLIGEAGEQLAEIHLTEIESEARSSLAPGAAFYWSIGYQDKATGREHFSEIHLHRLPLWSASELQRAERRANELEDLLNDAVAS
jgi:hypothetical protein